jgi:hypothetical protein
MLDAAYLDPKTVVAVRPKAPFQTVFAVATAKAGSGVKI